MMFVARIAPWRNAGRSRRAASPPRIAPSRVKDARRLHPGYTAEDEVIA
jgi:hypothetical protein